MASSFAHLHVHTEYSMLDGATRLADLVKTVKDDGQPAVAITDHGNLFGAAEFFKLATGAGITPIVGQELYVAPEDRTVAANQGPYNERYYHLTVLAKDLTGYRNLLKLSTDASLNGMFYKPRVDRTTLEQHSDGLIVLSGCLGSEVNQHLLHDNLDAARDTMGWYRDVFGPDRYLVEVMDHGLPEDGQVNPQLLQLAAANGLRAAATNDSHYTHASDAEAHDALLCIGTGALKSDAKRFKFHGDQFYVKSAAEMRELWRDHPEVCDSTLFVAEQVELDIPFGLDLLPAFPCPPGVTETEHLTEMVWAGAKELYGDPVPDHVAERIRYELAVIAKMGFPAYFLIVADLCAHAQKVGIRVGPGRGSAGGSVVAYCTRITRVDPIKHGLIFERFLNPARVEMPDIDIDFDDRRRGEMLTYSQERYGSDRVAQVITYGTIKAKSALRDSARVLGLPFGLGDKLTKAMPPAAQGREATLAEALEFDSFAELVNGDLDARTVVDTALTIEGLKRQHGVHAAAVIIGADPLTEQVPLMRTDEGAVVTQYDMTTCESIGLLKMDFLGLRNLTVISDAERHIAANRGRTYDLDDPGLLGEMDDPAVYEMLSTGNTLGVFQLDSSGMQELVRRLKPTRFEDISSLLALYRPGPLSMGMHTTFADRKNGREQVAYLHDALEPILGETYGVVVYQEQVMRIATDLAGFSMAEADALRKAVGKKKRDLMEAQKGKFLEGGVASGFERSLMAQLWDLIEKFAEYGFNKAHTVAYGVVSYQTAWLKTHYPVEYMAALLTSVRNNKDAKPVYLNECRRMGIDIRLPDVNTSRADFTPDGDDIRFGLTAIKGVGDAVVEAIVAARDEGGPFTSFQDFCNRVPTSALNKRVVQALIDAGAFTAIGHPRKGLASVYDAILEPTLSRRKQEDAGQFSLFGDAAPGDGDGDVVELEQVRIPTTEHPDDTLLKLERELLGLYVSDHPLLRATNVLASHKPTPVAELRDNPRDGATVTVAGLLTSIDKRFTKKGDAYLRATFEDLTGQLQMTVWPTTYQVAHPHLVDDAVLVVRGTLELRDGTPQLLADVVVAPDLTVEDDVPLDLHLHELQVTAPYVAALKDILARHAGDTLVRLHVSHRDGSTKLWKVGDRWRVNNTPELAIELRAEFGADIVRGLALRAAA